MSGRKLAIAAACLVAWVAVAGFAQGNDGRTWEDAVRLFSEGSAAYDEARFRDAIPPYEEALAIVRELNELYAEGVILNNLGNCYHALSDYGRAIDLFEQSLAIRREISDRAGEADSLGNLGNCHFSLSDYARAIDLYEQSLAIEREIGNRADEAACLNNLGMCYFSLSDYARVIDLFEQSLAIRREISDRAGEADSLMGFGLYYQARSDFTRAIDYFEQSLAIKRDLGDRAGEAASLGNLGGCYESISDYARAFDFYEQALAIFIEIDNPAGEAASLGNLGGCYESISDYPRAVDYHEQSLAIKRAIGDRAGEASSLGNLGSCYYSLSDYSRAIDLYDQSLAIKRAIGDRAGEAASLGGLGNCHYSLSDYGQAIDLYEQSLAIKREVGDRTGEASSLGNLGNCYESISDYARAFDCLEQALAIYVDIGNRADEAACLNNLGMCYFSLSDYGRAIDLFEQSLAIRREISDRAGEADSLGNLGNCYSSLSDYARATDLFEQALTLSVDLGMREVERKVQWGLGHTYRAMEQPQSATQHYEAALAIVESIRGNVDEEALRQSYFESVRTMYEEYLALLLELGRSDETFLVAERLRARTFLDGLYQAGLAPEQLQLEEAGIGRTRDETRPVMDFAALMAAVGDGQESLLPNEAVLEYMVTKDGIYLWVVTTGAISPPTFLPYPRQQLIEDVMAVREAIETMEPDPDLIALQDKLSSLYTNLVAPGLAQLGEEIDTLVFIPSGPLWYVPFAALPLRGQQNEEGNVPRMVERYTIAYLPSLASLTSLGGDEVATPSRGVVALANPTLSQKQIETLGMADTGYQYEKLEVAARDFSLCYVGQDETVYTGSDAEEPRAYRSGSTSDVAIYACHGMFNPYFPLQSKLLLAPGDAFATTEGDTRNPDDGDYYAWEALLTDHRGVELVILAACETLLPSFRNLQDAVGTVSGTDPKAVELTPEQLEQLVVGDEVVGLARAFLSSGAQSVLGTLWQANPGAVNELLVSMCRHHQAGLSWAQALCAAQRELIPMYANIWNWAPYQLIGRWR